MTTRMKSWAALLWLLAWAVSASAQPPDAALAAKFKAATEAQRAGRFDEAAAAYAEVIRLRPDIAEVYVNFGLVRHEQKQFDEAVKLFERAIALKPALAGAHLFLGLSQYSLSRYEPALKALEEAVRLAPHDPHALMWLGVASLAAGRTAEAAKHLDAAAALKPADVDILYHRGRAHFRLSQESYQQMFKADPKSPRVHQVLAQSYAEAGKDAEAIAEYETTIKLAPTLPGVREALGSLYWKNNRMDEAERMFEEELQLDPHSALVMYKAGGMRVERGQPERGLPLLAAAVRQNPELIDAYYYLGKAQGLVGQTEAAVANLRRVVEGEASAPIKESAHYQLSRLYRKLGRAAEAEAALAAFRRLREERERQREQRLEELKKQQPGEPARQP
jgi:tetratricopeptide (TPR) repeat protein